MDFMQASSSLGLHPRSHGGPRSRLNTLAWLIALLTVVCGSGMAATSRETPLPHRYYIGISPFLDKSSKDEVYRALVRLLVEDLPLNSTVAFYDAFALKTITQVSLPAAHVFNSPKTRANQFAPNIREIRSFLSQAHERPVNSHLRFEGAVRLPQLLDFLAGPSTNIPSTLLLIGSPMYEDAKEPAFSMVDGYFPSDGHLQTTRERSIFGFAEERMLKPELAIHWLYSGDPWVNELHKEKVTRFWSLYLERRGARLAAFSSDAVSVLQSFRHPGETGQRVAQGWTIDNKQTKIEMLRVTRDVGMADWLTRDKLPEVQEPPTTMIGRMKIGIRWKDEIDVDLYATPFQGAKTLFFQHKRSPEGYYYRDHRSSPGKEYEFIEFETPVDIREVEASINFYKGDCVDGPRGEVRIEFDGRIYGAPFAIAAPYGNEGRAGRSQHQFWTRIPIQQIVKLERIAN